jgi:hypothetical protein
MSHSKKLSQPFSVLSHPYTNTTMDKNDVGIADPRNTFEEKLFNQKMYHSSTS